jgi:hypothetical protein
VDFHGDRGQRGSSLNVTDLALNRWKRGVGMIEEPATAAPAKEASRE